jgi:dCTP deaminase
VSIEPGEFGILMTHEYLFVPPDLMAFISIRLTHKQKGLVNISGFHVDPGYYGQLMFAVFNAGPNDVPLRYNERVFMIMFNELKEWLPVKLEEGRWYGMENIPVETLSGLRGTSVSVRNLDERIKRLEMAFPVVVGGVVSVVIAVITWVLTHWG